MTQAGIEGFSNGRKRMNKSAIITADWAINKGRQKGQPALLIYISKLHVHYYEDESTRAQQAGASAY